MDGWVDFTLDTVMEALPSDVKTFYAQWIQTHPEKSGRLEELVSETVSVFRAAVASNADNVLDPVESRIPVTGYRHALNYLIFNLGMESGAQLVPEAYTLMTRADIWLRMVQTRRLSSAPGDAAGGSPSYTPGKESGVLYASGV